MDGWMDEGRRYRWMHTLGEYLNGWMDGGIDKYYIAIDEGVEG